MRRDSASSGLIKTKLHDFLNDFRGCQLLMQGISVVPSQGCDQSTNDVLIRIFLYLDLFLCYQQHGAHTCLCTYSFLLQI